MPAVSKSQQKAAGIALSAKRGDTPVSELEGAAKDMYDSMTEKELEDFAETKHAGLPNKKESVMLSKLFHEVRQVVREELNEKIEDFERGDTVHVPSINKSGVIVKQYGSKVHVKFVDGKSKTFNHDQIKNIQSDNINEAEEVQFNDLDSKEQKTIQALTKVLDVGKYPEAIFKSIHGTVVQFENSKAMGGYRFDIKELKALSRLPIRWIDSDKKSVNVGL